MSDEISQDVIYADIPSKWDHIYSTLPVEEKVIRRGYMGIEKTEAVAERTCEIEDADLVKSEIRDGSGMHTVMLDIDMDAALLASHTAGHYHLYIDKMIPWRKYKKFLRACWKAGIIEEGYYKASIKRGGSYLRVPWALDKGKE